MNLIELSTDFCQKYLSCLKRASSILKLTQSQSLCLNAVPFKGISQTDLANKLSLDLSTLSRNLDKLIFLDIVYKTSSNIDRRSYKISLTSQGEELYLQFNEIIKEEIETIYDKLELEEYDQILEILNKLNWQLELINK